MKITVWRNCVVVAELDVPEAPGPDLTLDPWSDLVGVQWEDGISQIPVSYAKHGLDSRECTC